MRKSRVCILRTTYSVLVAQSAVLHSSFYHSRTVFAIHKIFLRKYLPSDQRIDDEIDRLV